MVSHDFDTDESKFIPDELSDFSHSDRELSDSHHYFSEYNDICDIW